MHGPTTPVELARRAILAAADDPDAPLSAWPDRFPGRWVTAARVAELVGRHVSEVTRTLRELCERGEIESERPWPSSLRGYQPTALFEERPSSFHLPTRAPDDKRKWMLDELARWAAAHDGLAPSRADWSFARDPDRRWPRADRVAELFEKEACKVGVRRFVAERCANCTCASGRHYRNERGDEICMGCFDCGSECPYGDNGDWVGPSGWLYALQLAGLAVRTGADHNATSAQTLSRNRQMVTGGVADQWPQRFER